MKINNDDKLILRQSLQNRIVHYVGAFFLIFFMLFHLYFHIVRKEFDILPKKGDTKKIIEIIKAMILKKKSQKVRNTYQSLAYAFIGTILLLLVVFGSY